MKNFLFLSLLSVSTAIANDDYQNQIIQILEDGTTQYLTGIESSGTHSAPSTIIGESLFQLHTTNSKTGDTYLLDEVIVNGYNPKVAITIDSQDDGVYTNGNRYSRIGKPYTVNYNILGILPDSEVVAAHAVILEKKKTAISSTGLISEPIIAEKKIYIEGSHSETDDAAIGSASVVKDVYTFYKNVDESDEYTASINSATVCVFPNAEGNLLSAEPGDDSVIEFGGAVVEKYAVFPPIGIELKDVYPGASVALRIYAKGGSYNTEDDITIVTTGTESSYSNTFDLHEVSEKLENMNIQATEIETRYVIELIEDSVYGSIILDREEFDLHNLKITINGGLIGSE